MAAIARNHPAGFEVAAGVTHAFRWAGDLPDAIAGVALAAPFVLLLVAARRAFNSSCHPTGGSRSFTTDRCQGGG